MKLEIKIIIDKEMKTIYLSSGKFEYDNLSELSEKLKEYHVKLGNNVKLGDDVTLGNFVTLGNNVKLGNGVTLGKTPFYAHGLYRYHVCAYWHNGKGIIQLGCFVRTVDEWKADFWNNPSEFTYHDAPESKRRLFAFKMAKMWLKENVPEKL